MEQHPSSQAGTKAAPDRYRHNLCCYRTKLLLCPSWIRTGIRNTLRETAQKNRKQSRICPDLRGGRKKPPRNKIIICPENQLSLEELSKNQCRQSSMFWGKGCFCLLLPELLHWHSSELGLWGTAPPCLQPAGAHSHPFPSRELSHPNWALPRGDFSFRR